MPSMLTEVFKDRFLLFTHFTGLLKEKVPFEKPKDTFYFLFISDKPLIRRDYSSALHA